MKRVNYLGRAGNIRKKRAYYPPGNYMRVAIMWFSKISSWNNSDPSHE